MKDFRERHNLTQLRMAVLMGVDPQTISRWEREETPRSRMLELAFKLKQFACGMPGEVKEIRQEVSGTIDVEWEIAIRKAFGLAEPAPTVNLPVIEVAAPPAEVRKEAGDD